MFPLRQKKGQGLVEYMVLVALIAIGTVGVVRVVGSNIAVQFENINSGLGLKPLLSCKPKVRIQVYLIKKISLTFCRGPAEGAIRPSLD